MKPQILEASANREASQEDHLQPIDELDAAIDQAQALTALLENKAMNPASGGECSGRIREGIFELGRETFKRLRGAAVAALAGKDGAR